MNDAQETYKWAELAALTGAAHFYVSCVTSCPVTLSPIVAGNFAW